MPKQTDGDSLLIEQPSSSEELSKTEQPDQALVPAALTIIERAARDPGVSVEKLEKLIALQERVLDREAKAAFNTAFVELQAVLPVVVERARTDKGTYAPLEDIVEKVRPLLHEHGFSISHETLWPETGVVKVVGHLMHAQGAERTSEFMSEADTSGSKNAIQALGSAVSYGRRYTTNSLLGIVTRGEDDDGRTGVPAKVPQEIEEWLTDLEATADEGTPALEGAWATSSETFRLFVLGSRVLKDRWEGVKRRAAAATKRQRSAK
jgi:hypothetical protein